MNLDTRVKRNGTKSIYLGFYIFKIYIYIHLYVEKVGNYRSIQVSIKSRGLETLAQPLQMGQPILVPHKELHTAGRRRTADSDLLPSWHPES